MTDGSRSTEFWIGGAAFFFGAGLIVAGLVLGRDAAIWAGAFEQAIVAVGYAHSRGKAKSPRPYLAPPRSIG